MKKPVFIITALCAAFSMLTACGESRQATLDEAIVGSYATALDGFLKLNDELVKTDNFRNVYGRRAVDFTRRISGDEAYRLEWFDEVYFAVGKKLGYRSRLERIVQDAGFSSIEHFLSVGRKIEIAVMCLEVEAAMPTFQEEFVSFQSNPEKLKRMKEKKPELYRQYLAYTPLVELLSSVSETDLMATKKYRKEVKELFLELEEGLSSGLLPQPQ